MIGKLLRDVHLTRARHVLTNLRQLQHCNGCGPTKRAVNAVSLISARSSLGRPPIYSRAERLQVTQVVLEAKAV